MQVAFIPARIKHVYGLVDKPICFVECKRELEHHKMLPVTHLALDLDEGELNLDRSKNGWQWWPYQLLPHQLGAVVGDVVDWVTCSDRASTRVLAAK
jgi:hypothetical protein